MQNTASVSLIQVSDVNIASVSLIQVSDVLEYYKPIRDFDSVLV